jgi:hypothetical protein
MNRLLVNHVKPTLESTDEQIFYIFIMEWILFNIFVSKIDDKVREGRPSSFFYFS